MTFFVHYLIQNKQTRKLIISQFKSQAQNQLANRGRYFLLYFIKDKVLRKIITFNIIEFCLFKICFKYKLISILLIILL